MQVTSSSKRFTLNLNDFWKGLIMAVIGAIIGFIQGWIDGSTIEWDKIWHAALGAAVAYLIKNLFDKPKVVITDVSKEQLAAINNGDATAKILPK